MLMRTPQIWLPRRTIRFWLSCLVVVCIAPVVLVVTFIIVRSDIQERASFERNIVGNGTRAHAGG